MTGDNHEQLLSIIAASDAALPEPGVMTHPVVLRRVAEALVRKATA